MERALDFRIKDLLAVPPAFLFRAEAAAAATERDGQQTMLLTKEEATTFLEISALSQEMDSLLASIEQDLHQQIITEELKAGIQHSRNPLLDPLTVLLEHLASPIQPNSPQIHLHLQIQKVLESLLESARSLSELAKANNNSINKERTFADRRPRSSSDCHMLATLQHEIVRRIFCLCNDYGSKGSCKSNDGSAASLQPQVELISNSPAAAAITKGLGQSTTKLLPTTEPAHDRDYELHTFVTLATFCTQLLSDRKSC